MYFAQVNNCFPFIKPFNIVKTSSTRVSSIYQGEKYLLIILFTIYANLKTFKILLGAQLLIQNLIQLKAETYVAFLISF